MFRCKTKTVLLTFALSLGFSVSATLLSKRTQASAYPQIIAQLRITPSINGGSEHGIRIYSTGKVTRYHITPEDQLKKLLVEYPLLKVSKNLIPRLKKLIQKANPDLLKEITIHSSSCKNNPMISYEVKKTNGTDLVVGAQNQCMSFIPTNHDHASLEIRSILDALSALTN